MDYLSVFFRWFHIGPVILLVGGFAFWRYAVIPALSEDASDFTDRLAGKWKMWTYILISLILISGVYQVAVRIRIMPPIWHMLFFVKLLLAIGVFFLASALVGRSRGLQPIRDNRAKWLSITVILAALIVLVSGVMRYTPPKEEKEEQQVAVQWVSPRLEIASFE